MMENSIELIPYSLLAVWLIFSIYYVIRAVKFPEKINPYIFESIPQVFPSIGILGTFLGIAYGLWDFDEKDIEGSIPQLLKGLKTAFLASIFGVGLLIIFSKIIAIIQRRNEKGKHSEETTALIQIAVMLGELKNNFSESFIYKDENGNKVKPANYFRDIYEESKKQSASLQTFSTDLALTVSAGFEQILNNPNEGVVAELKLLRLEIENLGKKLQDPATEMTQNVVKDLQSALGNMIDEFKTSMSGSTKSELERLSTLLGQAGGSLTDFPSKLQSMTDNLNENFKGLQEIVQQISKQTLSQSEESTEKMKQQVEQMSKILTSQVGELQVGQEMLIGKQTENIQVSDRLLAAFNISIEKMNGLSNEVTETITKLTKVQNDFSSASGQLKSISENVNAASNNFKESQLRFSQQSSQFLDKNTETIANIQKTLITAREVSSEYANRFSIIEKGLQGIFNQIQTGLDDYKDTIGESLETFLGKYTEALTTTAESLASATAKQENILEELTEQLSKLNGRRN